ncbi:MAG: phosphatase PAP2 family protein [Thermomicrobiales bacterium]|nr:phosphatase PAP2 family protein [Thermomicrobiales bacterium]
MSDLEPQREPPVSPAPKASGGMRLRRWASDHQNILIRIGIAIVVVSAILLFNPSFIGWGAAVTAAIIAVPISRFRAYAGAFLPYGAAWLIFTLLRSLADETGVQLRTTQVTAIERALFDGRIPTIWLQERLFDPVHIHWYDYATTFIHWSYFFVPHVAAIIMWRKAPDHYRRYLIATVITLGIGLMVYFLSPAAPPWLTADRAPQQDIFRVMANVGRQINSSLYDRTYSALGDPNPVAAMPSLHSAITFLVFLFSLRAGWKVSVPMFIYSILMAFSLVYTGEHYVIDTLIGAAIATYAYVYSGRWLTVTAPIFQMVNRRTAPLIPHVPVGAEGLGPSH